MSIEQVLLKVPWIPYNDKFVQSRIILTHPENVIFAAQFLMHVMNSDVYQKFPYAEKMDPTLLQTVDWTKAIIVFDHNLQLKVAPDPVLKLLQLDRRLRYKEAAANIFGPFRFFPFLELFRFQWLGILLIFLLYTFSRLIVKKYNVRSLALSKKPSDAQEDPRP